MRPAETPVLGFAAFSDTGKTTLLENLLPLLAGHGLRVGVIKQTHHRFDVDTPGKDSYRLRKAGARRVLVASRLRWALMVENDPPEEPRLESLLARIDTTRVDLVLVEGFKHERFPKIELHRPSLGKPLLFPGDPTIIAVACDAPLPVETDLPVLDINNPGEVASFILERFLVTWPAARGRDPATAGREGVDKNLQRQTGNRRNPR